MMFFKTYPYWQALILPRPQITTMRPKTLEELECISAMDRMMAHASRYMPKEPREYQYSRFDTLDAYEEKCEEEYEEEGID